MGGSLVSWKTKKHKTVSKSSAESEIRSMPQTTSEIDWVDGVLEDLFYTVPKPIPLLCDNQSAHHIASDPVMHERTKHLKLDAYYVRERIEAGTVATQYVRSSLQIS